MDSTRRFSNRVENYVRYRPHYPVAIISYLQQQHGLTKDRIIADVGAGTGISSELFLEAGYSVLAIEPNKEMREKAQALLGSYHQFTTLDGSAEDTGLQAQSVDMIISGQAFHWFDVQKAKIEFKRVLKKDGIVVLMWNERQTSSAFEKEYDQLILRHARDYVEVSHRNIDQEKIAAFFAPQPMESKTFANKQLFELAGLRGRLLSSSYMPTEQEPGFGEMIKDLADLFNRFQENGMITINYATNVYSGPL